MAAPINIPFYPPSTIDFAEEPISTSITTRVDQAAQRVFLQTYNYSSSDKSQIAYNFKQRRVKKISGGAFGQVYRLNGAHIQTNMRLIEKVQNTTRTALRELAAHKYFLQNQVPNIPNLFEVYRPENDSEALKLHIVMQDAGKDIHKGYIKLGKLPKIGKLKTWIKRWLQTLSSMHELGYLHADIKPANLTEEFIIDLGLSFKVKDEPYFQGGTPYYIPPEMAKGEALTTKADSFSLGISLLEIVTQAKLLMDIDYTSEGRFSWFKLNQTFKSLPQEEISRRVRARILAKYDDNAETEELIHLIEGLLQKDPEKRLSSSDALKHPFFSTTVKPLVTPTAQNRPVVSTRERVQNAFAKGRNDEVMPWERQENMGLWGKIRAEDAIRREVTGIDALVGSSAPSATNVSKIHQVIKGILQAIKYLFIGIGYATLLPAAIYHLHKSCTSDSATHDRYVQMA